MFRIIAVLARFGDCHWLCNLCLISTPLAADDMGEVLQYLSSVWFGIWILACPVLSPAPKWILVIAASGVGVIQSWTICPSTGRVDRRSQTGTRALRRRNLAAAPGRVLTLVKPIASPRFARREHAEKAFYPDTTDITESGLRQHRMKNTMVVVPSADTYLFEDRIEKLTAIIGRRTFLGRAQFCSHGAVGG